MKHLILYLKIFLLAAIALPSNVMAGSVEVRGQKFKDREELSLYFYGLLNYSMENSITSKTLNNLQLQKINGKFLFVSPTLDTLKNAYIPNAGKFKNNEETALLASQAAQISVESTWYFFEKMGLVDKIDIIEENSYKKDIDKNYDYLITMRYDATKPKDIKEYLAKKTEYFLKNIKTGKEEKITEEVGIPGLSDVFDTVAVKFSETVKSIN